MGARHAARWSLITLLVAVAPAAAGQMTLLEAVKAGNTDTVRSLLQQKANVNAAEPDGSTALHWAAHRDDLGTAEMLIEAGADARAANRYGVTPLALACTNGSASLIEVLLKAGADANAASPEGETALMTAARTGKVDALKMLVAHRAKVNEKESWRGQTALMWAALENNVAATEMLVEVGADIEAKSKGGFTPLMFAVRAGHAPVVEALIKAGANINATLPDGNSPLHVAMINAHYALGVRLLEAGATVDANGPGWTPLHQLMWTRRPNTNRGTLPPVQTGRLDTMQMAAAFVKHHADLNARISKQPSDTHRHMGSRIGSTPLLLAAKAADAEMMRFLLASGADPQAQTTQHSTVLMYASGVGIWNVGESAGTNEEALEAVKAALELPGVDVNAVNEEGESAMHGAAYRGANAMVQLLFDKGAKLELKNKKGWTPIMITEGVHYPNTFQRRLDTAELLRKLAGARTAHQ